MSAPWQAFRDYQVRPACPQDHPLLAAGEANAAHCITVERHDGARKIFPSSWFWHDSDAWARSRWHRADREFRRMIVGEGIGLRG